MVGRIASREGKFLYTNIANFLQFPKRKMPIFGPVLQNLGFGYISGPRASRDRLQVGRILRLLDVIGIYHDFVNIIVLRIYPTSVIIGAAEVSSPLVFNDNTAQFVNRFRCILAT